MNVINVVAFGLEKIMHFLTNELKSQFYQHRMNSFCFFMDLDKTKQDDYF